MCYEFRLGNYCIDKFFGGCYLDPSLDIGPMDIGPLDMGPLDRSELFPLFDKIIYIYL